MVNDEVVAILVVHVDSIKIAATKESRIRLWQISPRDSLRNILARLRGRCVVSTRELIRWEPWRFRTLSLFEILSNVSESQETSPIPASPSINLRHVGSEDPAVDVSYREMVGSLMWIANQTPDTANAVRAVARFSHDPKAVSGTS